MRHTSYKALSTGALEGRAIAGINVLLCDTVSTPSNDKGTHVPVEHESFKRLDFHTDLLFLNRRRKRWRSSSWQAMHRRC